MTGWRRTNALSAAMHVAALAVWPFTVAYVAVQLALDRYVRRTR